MSKSSTIIESEDLPNPSPGDILRLDFLEPVDMTPASLARALLLLARRVSPGFFLGLQADFDLMQRRRELGDDLEAIKPRAA
jgi:plasmid maintenance system antidote protein VapI